MSLTHHRITPRALGELTSNLDDTPISIDAEQRRLLAERFVSLRSPNPRRLDAWSVEQAGAAPRPFRWSATTARRSLANGARRRLESGVAANVADAVRDEIDAHIARCVRGDARFGSLAHWLAGCSPAVLALVTTEATSALTELLDVVAPITNLSFCTTDAYYDVAGARTSLRGRRDALVTTEHGRVIVRLRGGAPGPYAGAGLRADLVIDALSEPSGRAATRIVGLWPDAGVALSVTTTLADLRAGARDLVRTAMVSQRRELAAA